MVVLTPDDFKKWLESSTSGDSLAQDGERLFASLSCAACHNTRPDARGPSLANVYGAKLTLSSGQAITADDAYLRESILSPSQHITQGYAPIMPTYQGQVSEEGVLRWLSTSSTWIRTIVSSRQRIRPTCSQRAKDLRRGASPLVNNPARRGR